MRVLYLSTDLQRGGYPLRLVRTAQAIRAIGVEPVVGSLAGPGPLHETLANWGIPHFSCDASGRFDVRFVGRLAQVIRRFNPDLVHSGLFHANIAARLVGRADRPRPVVTSTATIEIERRWHIWGEALSASAGDLHVVNSESVAEHVIQDWGLDPRKVAVVRNGLDLAAIDAAPPVSRASLGVGTSAPVIVWAGRMDPIKGLDVLIETLALLRERRPVEALLVGDGPLRAEVDASIRRRGLEKDIHLLGWRGDVASIMKASNVLLFPSRSEGSPNVVLEAMACGCPVAASDIPSCRDLVTPGRSGELCPAGHAPGFAQAIERILDEPGRREGYIRAARERVESGHSLPAVVARLGQIYQMLLG